MPRSGVGTNFSQGEELNDLTAVQPGQIDTWGALFRQATQNTLGRTSIDRFFLEHPSFGGQGQQTLPVDQINQKYNLNLNPSNPNQRVSEDFGAYMQRKQIQSYIDQTTIQQGQPSLPESLGAGLIGSLTDPAEFAINLIPVGRLFKFGELAAGATKIPSAIRFAQRASRAAANPWLSGAIEGTGQTLLSAPFTAANSKALGQEYGFDDALTDIAVSGVAGSLLQGGAHILSKSLQGKAPTSALNMSPIDKETSYLKAASDFNNGHPVQVEKTVNADETLANVQKTRRDITAEILKQDASEPFIMKLDKAPENLPVEDISPEIVQSKTFQDHATPLEKRMLSLTDPETFKAEVGTHVEGLNGKLGRLADYMALPKEDFLQVASDALALQNEVLSDVQQLNELFPSNKLSTEFKTTQSGLLNKNTLKSLGNKINALNEMALSPVSDADKVTTLTNEFTRLRNELKAANKSLAQAETKGLDSAARHREQVNLLTPQVQQAQTLLRALGEEAHAPELSFTQYIADELGGKVQAPLFKYLSENPTAKDQPVYRVRKQVFDNVMRRLNETEQYLKSSDEFNSVTPSKFPENDKILSDVRRELADIGEVVDTDAFHQTLFERVSKELQAQKALGIFDENALKRFDAIEEQFKTNVEKTEAVKKGAVQAQICALGGVSEDGGI